MSSMATWAWQRGRFAWSKWDETGATTTFKESDASGDFQCEHWVRMVFGLWWRTV